MFPCATNPEWFFSNTESEIAEAKALCASCHRRDVCRADGYGHEVGVWGGLSAVDRMRLDPLQARRLSKTLDRDARRADRAIVVRRVLGMNENGVCHQEVANATGLSRKAVVEIVHKARKGQSRKVA